MTQHVVFLLLGLSNGAVFAALALGLVLTYRSSGVVNFATGSIALFTTYLYAELRQGQLMSVVPGTDALIDLHHVFGLWTAMALSLVGAGLLGLLLHVLVFRPLRQAPPVAKAVASLGVSVVITSSITVRQGSQGVAPAPIFPSGTRTFGGVRISTDRVYFALTIIGVAVVLTVLYRFTRFGLQTRAAAESEKGAYVSGISPDKIAARNWIISSVVAGLAGILISPINQVVPITYTLFTVPALAAAVIGGFNRLLPATFAGLAIGMVSSDVGRFGTYTWLPSSGLIQVVPLVLILLVLVVRARPLPSRGALVVRSLGRAPRPRGLLLPTLVPAAIGLAGVFLLQDQWRIGLITSMTYAIISLSLVVVTGYAGQVSLAQLTLAGVGGFLVGPITTGWGVPFPIAPILAGLFAMILGVVVGLPALRIRGLTVAVVTLTLAYALENLWFNNTDFVGTGTGVVVPSPHLFGQDLGIGTGAAFPRSRFGVVVLVTLVLVAFGVAKLRKSTLGSQMLAVRANERSAAAAGIDVTRVKIAAFGIASFIAGIGGSMLAYRQGTVTDQPFSALLGLALFTTAYLAGITSVSGGILAGVLAAGGLVSVATDQLGSAGDWYDVISGIVLILILIFNPEGLVGPAHSLLERRRRAAHHRGTGLREAAAPPPRDRSLRVVPAASHPVALSMTGVTVRYGGVTAVSGVTINVPEGLIVGLIGPNGAGKTTLIDSLGGLTGCEGAVYVHDRDVSKLKPFERTRAGLGRTFQAIELYDDLSVEENVLVGLTGASGRGAAADEVLAETFRVLGLEDVRHRPAGDLSQGQRQLVSIARALAGQPKVLLLDEPAGGLDSTESHWLGDRLRDIRDSGVTILIVDHDMSLVLSLCDQIHVLNFGEQIAVGTPREIRSNPEVTAAYLGGTHAEEVTA